MNVTVFGSTGAIGSLTVGELLASGHTVTAYARNPEKVPSAWRDQVRLVVGEITDAQAIGQAVAGADVVVSALGPSLDRKATGLPLVAGTGLILDAMAKHDVDRFVGHGTPSILDRQEKPVFQTRLISFMGRHMFPRAYEELLGMTTLVTESGFRWTIVRFTAPKDGDKKNELRVGFYGTDKVGFAITRADIAAFTAAQVDDDTYVSRAPAISN